MNKLLNNTLFLCIVCLNLLLVSGCAPNSPESRRLTETTSIGVGLGVALAYAVKADPVVGAILGGVLGFSEGKKINKEIENRARSIDTVNAHIYKLERSNRSLRREIEVKKEISMKFDDVIEDLQSKHIAHNQKCRENYYRYRKVQYSIVSQIKNLENKKQSLRNKISSIEKRDYNFKEKQELNKLRELDGSLEEYIYQIYNIKRRVERVLDILQDCL